MSSLGGIESCDVQAERRVSRGGAVVRTAEGEVDARWRRSSPAPATSSSLSSARMSDSGG